MTAMVLVLEDDLSSVSSNLSTSIVDFRVVISFSWRWYVQYGQ